MFDCEHLEPVPTLLRHLHVEPLGGGVERICLRLYDLHRTRCGRACVGYQLAHRYRPDEPYHVVFATALAPYREYLTQAAPASPAALQGLAYFLTHEQELLVSSEQRTWRRRYGESLLLGVLAQGGDLCGR